MGLSDFILHEAEYKKIHAIGEKLLREANSRIVFLLDRNGQPIAHAGDLKGTDPTSLASLAAGNVAATEGLAQLIGEDQFANLYHEGDKEHIHLTVVKRVILVVIFDERSSLGLVRLRVRQAMDDLVAVLDEIEQRAAKSAEGAAVGGAEPGMVEFTDADLDALFGD